ncbi:MAG: hypothetical protein K2L74_09485 [Muribaculaceae bacterium]|nr:hypothetical protein [Muribaculaceae bacterium]
MLSRTVVFILCVLAAARGAAQTELPAMVADTVPAVAVQADTMRAYVPGSVRLERLHYGQPDGLQWYPLSLMEPGLSFAPEPVYPGAIYRGDNMELTAYVGTEVYPGLMNKATGRAGVSFGNERLSFYAGGIVNQYSFHGGMIRQLGLSGRISFRASSPLSFTAFADYYADNSARAMPGGGMLPPSMLGFYDVSRFGGYADYRISERFGVQVGAQAVERIGPRNRYEFEPIATPYVMVGSKKKVAVGLPVGQILYGILRGNARR